MIKKAKIVDEILKETEKIKEARQRLESLCLYFGDEGYLRAFPVLTKIYDAVSEIELQTLKWFRRGGQKAKMKKSDIPQEIRLKFGEPAVTDPAAEEEVEIVSEVDPESVKVRYRGEIFPVNKKQLKYGEKNALKPIRLMSDSELMKEYTRLKTFDEGRLFRYRLKRIEKEIERRGIDKYNTKEATTNFSLPSGIAGLLLEDGEKCAWIANATENGKKEKQKEENQTQRSKKSTRRFSVWDVLDGQIIRSGKLVK